MPKFSDCFCAFSLCSALVFSSAFAPAQQSARPRRIYLQLDTCQNPHEPHSATRRNLNRLHQIAATVIRGSWGEYAANMEAYDMEVPPPPSIVLSLYDTESHKTTLWLENENIAEEALDLGAVALIPDAGTLSIGRELGLNPSV